MGSFSTLSVTARFKFIVFRLLACTAAIIIYLTVWRPIRVAITEQFVFPQVRSFQNTESDFNTQLESGSLLIHYSFGDATKQLQYRPAFGFFFLLTLMALFFVSDQPNHYGFLAALHLIASILTYLFLMTAASGFPIGFIITDAISGYLTPALSLSLVPLVMKDFL